MEQQADDDGAVPQSHSRSGESSSDGSTPSASNDYSNDPPPEPFLDHSTAFHPLHSFPARDNEGIPQIREDTWSCIIVVLTFWFFVSMTLILGVYGSTNLLLGVNSSILVKPKPLFVEYIKVESIGYENFGPKLYGFYGNPRLDVATIWSETRSTSLPTNTHKEWVYFLNQGSQINISYSVKSESSSSLILVIAQGNEGFAQWLQDPSCPNITLSWNIIHGTGMIQQNILEASSYYVAVGNLNSQKVEVQLNLWMRAYLYNTTEAYYECALAHGQCSFKLFFPEGNTAVLTSPGLKEGAVGGEWYVKLSYGPRWITYIIGSMTILVLMAFHNNFRCMRDADRRAQSAEIGSQRAPLLFQKDDDISSWGSSYDSLSQDDEDLEDALAGSSLEGKPLRDDEYYSNIRRLCAICFDAPRDCFFLPCGHCIACFGCGRRIAEAAGTCPICRRKMKKVKRIFAV